MDRIKEVQDDPAKRKQALKSMLCSDSLHLAVCIAMVVVGVQVGYNALFLTIDKFIIYYHLRIFSLLHLLKFLSFFSTKMNVLLMYLNI